MSPFVEIKVNSSGQFVISGELVFDTVQQIYPRGCQLISASPLPIFDCKQVNKIDNASLALILSWIKCAKNLHKTIKFLNIPQQLLAIAKVSGLEDVIMAKSTT